MTDFDHRHKYYEIFYFLEIMKPMNHTAFFLGNAVIMRNINNFFDHRRPSIMTLSIILGTIIFLTIIKIMIFHNILYNT